MYGNKKPDRVESHTGVYHTNPGKVTFQAWYEVYHLPDGRYVWKMVPGSFKKLKTEPITDPEERDRASQSW